MSAATTSRAVRVASTLGMCLIVGLVGLQPAHAEDPATINIEVANNATVKELLDVASETLGLQFIWSREKSLTSPIQGRPVFRGSSTTVFNNIRTLLHTYDLALIPIGRAQKQQKTTYRVADMRATSVGMSLRAEPIELNDGNLATFEAEPWRYVTTTITMENATDMRNMRSALSRIVTGSSIGQITEVPDARALMMTDFAPKVVSAYRMIKRMDVKPPQPHTGPRMTVIKMEYARARDLARLIETLMMKPSKGGPLVAPRVVADDRTNQIVLSGEAGLVSQVEMMIKQLDVPGTPRTTPPPRPPVTAHVVRLNAMLAQDAAKALTLFVRGATKLFVYRPTVVALQSTNALVIAGTERAHQILGELIRSLDKAPSAKDEGK